MSLKVVERSVTSLGGRRWTWNFSESPCFGIGHFVATMMSSEILKGHSCKYHLNGCLLARSATYQGV